MTLTAQRRSALVPDQHPPAMSNNSMHLTRQEDLINNGMPFSSFTFPADSQPLPYSSWDLATQLASTPRQDASSSCSSFSLCDTTPLQRSQTAFVPASSNNVLDTFSIDQWLFTYSNDVTPFELTGGLGSSFPPINQPTPPNTVNLQDSSLPSSSSSARIVNLSTPTPARVHTHSRTRSAPYTLPTPYRNSREIVLRSMNGDASQDIYYPQTSIIQTINDDGRTVLVTGGLVCCSSPPTADFAPDKGDKAAKGQPEKRRCNDDIYTPLWVRGEGINREGWCSLCDPGRWLNLKTSQYLYHMQNTHGVIQTSGLFCHPPVQLRRHEDSVGTTEGLCGNCEQWIAICTVRKRRSFSAWFEHARKCHSSRRHALLSSPFQHRRAVSSSPAMRLRATKKEGHQRVSSLQEVSSYVDFADSPGSSSSVIKIEDCDIADNDSSTSKRHCSG
jgi:hypothetical protein